MADTTRRTQRALRTAFAVGVLGPCVVIAWASAVSVAAEAPAAAPAKAPAEAPTAAHAADDHHHAHGPEASPKHSAETYDRFVEEKLAHTYPATAMRMLAECGGIREGLCLDLGCGSGHLDVELARRSNLKIIGLDIDPGMKPLFEKRLAGAGFADRVSFVEGDAQKLPFPDHHADIIVSRGMLIFLPDIGKCLREVERVLKPTGVAFLGGRYLYAPKENHMTIEQLRKAVADSGVAGAEVIDWRGQWVKICGPQAPQAARDYRPGPDLLVSRFAADYGLVKGDCLLICRADGALEQRLQQGFCDAGTWRVTALYPNEKLAEIARTRIGESSLRGRIRCEVGDVHALPLEASSFDAVASLGGAPFWKDRAVAFSELHRVLRPGGAALAGGRHLYMPDRIKVSSEALRETAAKTRIETIRVLDVEGQWVEIRKPPVKPAESPSEHRHN